MFPALELGQVGVYGLQVRCLEPETSWTENSHIWERRCLRSTLTEQTEHHWQLPWKQEEEEEKEEEEEHV